MLQFNELSITPDGKYLIVDVQVQELDYYENVYIDSIYYDTQKTFVITGQSDKAVAIYTDTTSANKKSVRVVVDIDSIGDNLFFIYANAKGDPSEDTPCGMKATVILGVVYNRFTLYKTFMKYIKQLDGCNLPADFINLFLRHKVFTICLKTGDYTSAINYWNKFLSGTAVKVITSKCGCNG